MDLADNWPYMSGTKQYPPFPNLTELHAQQWNGRFWTDQDANSDTDSIGPARSGSLAIAFPMTGN